MSFEATGAVAGLAAKLDALDLTDTERLILETILERAADVDEDVGGFSRSFAPLLSRVKVKFPGALGIANHGADSGI